MTLISVIVPVFNGAATLAATLRSALAQTHRDIEVIVIDDGSTDETPAIAARIAASDSRLRLISQANRGLAATRNRGLAEAAGAMVAPLDADDLWHPRKLELQARALADAGEGTVLSYGWFAAIGADDRVLTPPKTPRIEGAVFHRHLDYNFISNGSSPLMRTGAARKLGYDTALPSCEDYKLQLELALVGRFVCVPAVLTGYRKVGGSMSSNAERMLLSHIAVLDSFRSPMRPQADRIIDRRIAEFEIELARHRGRRGQLARAARYAFQAASRAPLPALRHGFAQLRRASWGRPGPDPAGAAGWTFPHDDPFAPLGIAIPDARQKRLAPLRRLDEEIAYLG